MDALVAAEHGDDWKLHAVRHANIADHRARPCDRQCGVHRLPGSDAFERRIDPHTVRHLQDGIGRLRFAPCDNVGGTELTREPLPGRVAAQGDDPVCTESPGCEHAGESHRAVPHDSDDVTGLDPRADRRVVARAHHIRQRQQ